MTDNGNREVSAAPASNASATYASLENPLKAPSSNASEAAPLKPYDATLARGAELQERPYIAAGERNILRQHLKNRMTIWERIRYLAGNEPHVLYQNWGLTSMAPLWSLPSSRLMAATLPSTATTLPYARALWTRPMVENWHVCLS